MRVGLVRLVAIVLLSCTPALVMAAPGNSARAPKARVAKAPKVSKSKFQAPLYSAIIVDAATGQVLSEENADARSYPASLTKMMTLYMLFEALERHEVQMDTKMPVSKHAAQAAPSKLSLRPKSTISVEDAIQAIVTKSANDVAVVIGERLGGTEERFAEKATARAHQLGMAQTTFKNASGLPDPQQFSSARDMATLAGHLIKDFPQYYPQFSRMDFTYQGQTIHTHNHLLEFYEGADGIKTGYTAASGFNLVASATRNGYRIIGVMFGGVSANARDKRLAGLMDGGFAVLSGQPETLIAGRSSTYNDPIGAQIAQAKDESSTEEGDRDEPFMPVTDTVPIETTSLPPLPPVAKSMAAKAVPAPRKMAALEPKAAMKPAVPAADAPIDMSWGVQIGAFSTRAKADAQVATALNKVRATYVTARALVIPVKIKNQIVYRARIVGLGNDDLMKACALIPAQAKSGGCQAVTPDPGKVASR